jgi:hypothetical protein
MFITASLIFAVYACTSAAVVHYPPNASATNNLTFALTGTGAPGIYTSSDTPNEEYGMYNWCNMPHVRPREYKWVLLQLLCVVIKILIRLLDL